MEKLRVVVEIPIESRGKNNQGEPISDEELAKQTSYVLNIFLERYCQYIGAPKLGLISANGHISEVDD